MKNPKRKGSAFERQVADLLSLWWLGELNERKKPSERVFWRSPASGVIKEQGFTGDVIPVAGKGAEEFGKLVHIECKSRRNINLWKVLKKPDSSEIIRWLDKAHEEARDKVIWLIVRLNYDTPYLVQGYYTDFYVMPHLIPFISFEREGEGLNCFIISKLSAFLLTNDPDYVIQQLRDHRWVRKI